MRFVTGYAVTLCVSVLAGCCIGWNGLNGETALASLLIGALIGLFAVYSSVPGSKRSPGSPAFWEWFTGVVFLLFALRAFCWLIYYDGDSIKTLSPNNLGDLSLHLTYIRTLAGGVSFWPDNPIFASEKLHYPLGMDLFNSLLLLRGVPIERGLIWMGLLGSLATGVALWRWGQAFGMAGFLFNGGLAGFAFLSTHQLGDFQADLAWKSIPLSMLVTQRGLLYALPCGLLLLETWRARFFDQQSSTPLWVQVVLYATLPLFHLHTFLFLSILLAVWFLCGVAQRQIVELVGWSFVPATLLVSQVVGFSGHHSLIHLQPGWMQGDQNFFSFWLTNFGILPFLLAVLCFVLARQYRERKRAALFVLPATGLFVVSCFVMWAPWAWDNTKLMIWCYLLILPFLWSEVLVRWNTPARVIACFGLFFSGFVSLAGGLDRSHTGHEIAHRLELASIAKAVERLPRAEVFAACPTWNHPLLLNGRKLAVGYDGHLWSHGIDYLDSMHLLDQLMSGAPDWRNAAARLKIRYLFWGPLEQAKWPNSSLPWQTLTPCVAKGEWGAIYNLQSVL